MPAHILESFKVFILRLCCDVIPAKSAIVGVDDKVHYIQIVGDKIFVVLDGRVFLCYVFADSATMDLYDTSSKFVTIS